MQLREKCNLTAQPFDTYLFAATILQGGLGLGPLQFRRLQLECRAADMYAAAAVRMAETNFANEQERDDFSVMPFSHSCQLRVPCHWPCVCIGFVVVQDGLRSKVPAASRLQHIGLYHLGQMKSSAHAIESFKLR